MTNFWFIFLPEGLSENGVTLTGFRDVTSATFKSHPRQPAPHFLWRLTRSPFQMRFKRWSFAGNCFDWSVPKVSSIPNCSFRESCANIFFSSARPKLWHSELCSQKFLSTSSRVSLDDLIISRKAATPPWLRISELLKKNCWWHWQGMRDTLDLSSYHRDLSSRIASDINFPFHSFASRRKENSFFCSSSLCFSLNRCCNHVAVTIKLFFCLLILSSFTLYRQSTSSRTGTNFVFAPSQCQYLCSIAVHLWCLSNVGKYDKLNWGWGISRAFELNWGEICGTSAWHDGSTFCGFCWLERFFDGKMATTRG